MGIKDWPEGERPREKLLAKGPTALSDAELLAIFLRTGVQGMSAVDLSRDLLQRFSGLHGLLSASKESFCEAKGLGHAKYVQLQAVLELTKRHIAEGLTRETVFTSPQAVKNFLQVQLTGRYQEVFMVMFLDNRHRLIVAEELFYGTIDGASVYPREVVRRALDHNAAAVILAHNHPSGVADPSKDDHEITQQLKKALALIDVRVLDHIIVGSGTTASLAELGDL